jgi:hypothetical protein
MRFGDLRHRAIADAPPVAPAPDAATSTGADGSFELPVAAAGTYLVTAQLAAGGDVSRSVEVPEPALRVDVELAAPQGPPSIRGRVVCAAGASFRGWIKFVAYDAAGYASASRWTRPDGEGRFAFRGLAGGKGAVSAVAPDEAFVTRRGVELPSSDEVVLTIGSSATRHGRVVAYPDGAPIPGAVVVATTDDGDVESGCRVVADAAGAFVVPRAERLILSAGAPEFESVLADASSEQQDMRLRRVDSEEIVLSLRHAGAVAGRVLRSSDGSPVAGAVVVATTRAAPPAWTAWRRTSVSAADGTYRLGGCEPGRCDVFVLGGGWASVGLATWSKDNYDEKQDDPFAVDVAPGGTSPLDLRVEPTARIHGRVLGPTGAALLAIKVVREFYDDKKGPLWRAPRVNWTVSDGTFAFDDDPGGDSCSLEATSAGFAPRSATIQPESGKTSDVELRFDEPQRLEAVVRSAETGAPVPKATVDAVVVDESSVSGTGCRGATDAEGRCVLVNAPPGRLAIEVGAAGFVRIDENHPAEATQDATDTRLWRVEVRLQAAFVVAGRVLNADGSPAAGLSLQLTTPHQPDEDGFAMIGSSVDADEHGGFRIEGVPAGSYWLCRWPDRKLEAVVAGAPEIVVRLPAERAAIELTFVGPDGTAVPNGLVCFRCVDGSGFGKYLKAGRLVVPAKYYSGGDVVIAVSQAFDDAQRPLPLGAATFAVSAPLPSTLEIRFPPERVTSGRVVGPDGGGVCGAKIRARFAERGLDDDVADCATAADGSFEVRQLGDGAYRLEIVPPTVFVPPAPVDVHGGDKDVVVKLAKSAGGLVSVLDYDGKPVRGAVVEVRATKVEKTDDDRETKPLVHVVADADGKARVEGIVPGTEVALFVVGPGNRDDLAAWSASPWIPRDVEVRLERRK